MADSIRTIASNFQVDVGAWRLFFEAYGGRQKRLLAGYLAYIEEMAAKGLPPIFEGSHLGKLLGTTPKELGWLTTSTEVHYRSFSIPKRSGGERTIVTPSPLLLHCQRWIDAFILRKLPVHNAAHGYVVGRSNITNARVHLGSKQLLSLDISCFFDNIGEEKIAGVFYKAGYPPAVSFLMASLCCYNSHLPQGAASSPQLSNIVMRDFDAAIEGYARGRGLVYSRYVDDIALSGEHVRPEDVQVVEEALERSGLTLNPQKVRYQRGRKKVITGISIGSGKLLVPRALRRRFRNEAFLAMRHVAEAVDKDPIAIERHLGQLAYWLNVEPENERARLLSAQLKILTQSKARQGVG